MEEGKHEFPLSGKPEDFDIFKNYYPVAEKKTDQWLIGVTTNGVEMSEKQANRLIGNTHKAAQIARKINNGPINGYESELILRFPKEKQVALISDLKARKELLDHDDESQTAAVIHEMIHGIEEEIPDYYRNNPQEAVPLAAEFIFGGDSRLSLFTDLTNKVIAHAKKNENLNAHSRGWQKALQLLQDATDAEVDLTRENTEDIINKLLQLRELGEDNKIALIQGFIEQGKKGSNK